MHLDTRVTRLNARPIASGRVVVYWMQRSQRSRSNLALNEAIEHGNVRRQPVLCYFGLDDSYPHTMARDYRFMLEGLQDVAVGLRERNVGFVVRPEGTVQGIVRLAGELQASLVITDESHLRLGRRRRNQVTALLDADAIPLWSVDNDLVVPVRAIGREQYSARTIRPPAAAPA
jgi:deoxyribodipyrimidine photo-lyase